MKPERRRPQSGKAQKKYTEIIWAIPSARANRARFARFSSAQKKYLNHWGAQFLVIIKSTLNICVKMRIQNQNLPSALKNQYHKIMAHTYIAA